MRVCIAITKRDMVKKFTKICKFIHFHVIRLHRHKHTVAPKSIDTNGLIFCINITLHYIKIFLKMWVCQYFLDSLYLSTKISAKISKLAKLTKTNTRNNVPIILRARARISPLDLQTRACRNVSNKFAVVVAELYQAYRYKLYRYCS